MQLFNRQAILRLSKDIERATKKNPNISSKSS